MRKGGVVNRSRWSFPKFAFNEEEYNFGDIKMETVSHVFRFTNTGDAP